MGTKIVALSELCKISGRVGWKGYTVDDLREEGPLVIGANDIDSNHQLDLKEVKHISREKYEESPEIMIDKYDILIVKVGSTIGKVAIVDQDLGEACINPNTVLLKNCKINPFYIYYTLISSYGQSFLLNNSSASAQPALNQTTLKEMPIHLPEDENWINNITKSLNRINSKIKLNNRINRELEAMAKTLYDYWFVQFEFPFDFAQGKPNVPGVVAERSRGYKSSGGKMVYNAELKREIPEGWEVKELSEICSFISRGISPVYLDEGGICVLNQKCIRNRTVLYDEARRNDNNIRNAEAKRILKYDVLVNSTGVGTLGRVAVVNRLAEDFVTVDSHVTIVRANTELINKFYFGFTLLEKQKEIEGFSNGSTGQVELSRSQLESLKLIVPANEIQVKFEKIYKNCLDKMAINLEQNQHLASLRDWLLPMLMNGQVTVRQAHGNTVKEAEERLSSSTERSLSEVEVSRSMAAEPVEKYTPKGNEH